MKILILIIFYFIFFLSLSQAQKIQRSTVGANGFSGKVNASGSPLLVIQSVGQSSATGTFKNNSNIIREGFIQPDLKVSTKPSNENKILKASLYPNPASQTIHIAIEEAVEEGLTVVIYDLQGKELFTRQYTPTRHIQLEVGAFANGHYLLQVNAAKKSIVANLIKGN